MASLKAAIALAQQEGEALWFNHDLLVFKATSAQTDDAFILFEQTAQRGKMTPLHRHPNEDETFIVLEGQLIVHAFLVTSDVFRGLILFTPGNEDCEAWFQAAGDPAPSHELPPPGPPDIPRLKAAAEKYGVEMLGPPPFAADIVPEPEPAAH